jgi:lysine 2,3-aminomutase
MKRAPMSVRVSPYLVSLIDWEHPYEDPLRIQFFPLASRLLPDHPKLDLDSLHEQADAPVAGLTHRYRDKALFLPLDTCPVYCRFCTRSVRDRPRHRRGREGAPAPERGALEARVPVHRLAARARGHRHQRRRRLPASRAALTEIGEALLAMPNVRRMRFATKGPAVMPMKILTDDAWVDALTRVVEKGAKLHKDVVLHTHFNTPTRSPGSPRPR